MATPFEEFVNRELPRRSALLGLTLAGWDDNPNLPGAPAILQGAPLGTWFHEDTADVYWRKYKSGWNVVGTGGGGSGGGDFSTTTDLLIPVDFNDAGAVDPPAGAVFSSQDVVDDILTGLGATSFKHIDRVYNALPTWVEHEANLVLAGGVHRPSGDTSAGWELRVKNIGKNGTLFINGPLPSDYIGVVGSYAAPLTVDSYVSASDDPSMTFLGTPFAGLNLRGRFAITDSGQATVIHDHDDSTLYVTNNLSPAPATCWVGRPAAVLRCSLDDVNNYNPSVFRIASAGFIGGFRLEDMAIEGFKGNGIIASLGDAANVNTLRFVVDDLTPYEDFGAAPNGRPFQLGATTGFAIFRDTAYAAPIGVGGNDQLLFTSGGNNTRVYFFGFYSGPATGFALDQAVCTFRNTVFDTLTGTYELGLANIDGMFLHFSGSGVANTMRNCKSVRMSRSEVPVWGAFGAYSSGLIVKNCSVDACVRLLKDSVVDLAPSHYGMFGYKDGGGNAGVGFELVGPNAYLKVDSSTDLSGADGDVKMADGSVWSYSDIATYGPIVDEYGNRVEVV